MRITMTIESKGKKGGSPLSRSQENELVDTLNRAYCEDNPYFLARDSECGSRVVVYNGPALNPEKLYEFLYSSDKYILTQSKVIQEQSR